MSRRARALVTAACLAALPAFAAGAVTLDVAASELGGNTVVVEALGPGALAVDPAFASFDAMRLVLVLEPGDVGAPLTWNALVSNVAGELWAALRVALESARFATVGSVRANAGGVAGVDAGETEAVIAFDPAEPAGVDLGAPFGTGTDWAIDLGGLAAGESFALVFAPVAVPEPAALALLGLGLAALGARRRPRAPR